MKARETATYEQVENPNDVVLVKVTSLRSFSTDGDGYLYDGVFVEWPEFSEVDTSTADIEYVLTDRPCVVLVPSLLGPEEDIIETGSGGVMYTRIVLALHRPEQLFGLAIYARILL